jgi:hypothetical protein
MTWEGSDRRERLPDNWQAVRLRILERDQWRCTIIKRDGSRCWDRATDVHHRGDSTDHRPDQLTSVCGWHHARLTAAEGNAARKRPTNKRTPERHPGLRD